MTDAPGWDSRADLATVAASTFKATTPQFVVPDPVTADEVSQDAYGSYRTVSAHRMTRMWGFETAEKRDAFVAAFAARGAKVFNG